MNLTSARVLLLTCVWSLGFVIHELAPGLHLTSAIVASILLVCLGATVLVKASRLLILVLWLGGTVAAGYSYFSVGQRGVLAGGNDETVLAIVESVSPAGDGRSRAMLNVVFSLRADTASAVNRTFRASYPSDLSFLPGDTVVVEARAMAMRGKRNPADFDYRTFLRRRGLAGHLFIESGFVMGRPSATNLQYRLRSEIRSRLDANISRASAPLLAALILGDRSGLEDATIADFRQTGLVHLLAVSGLHVLLVGFLLFRLLGPLLAIPGIPWMATQVCRCALTAVVLLSYLSIVQYAPSVLRAVVMALVFLVYQMIQRSNNSLNTVGIAMLFVLVLAPHDLFSPGFQLSFGAVGALILLGPMSRSVALKLVDRFGSNVWTKTFVPPALTSIVALVGTSPALLYHFGSVAFGGIVLNVLAIPLTAASLLSGIVALVCSFSFPAIADSFWITTDVTLTVLRGIASAAVKPASLLVASGYISNLLVIMALVTLICSGTSLFSNIRWKLISISFSLMLFVLTPGIFKSPVLSVIFFDVEHGDAILLSDPGGSRVLIDTGDRRGERSYADRSIIPFLKRMNINNIDLVVLSHAHADHIGGLQDLVPAVNVRYVLSNGSHQDGEVYSETIATLEEHDVALSAVTAGQTFQVGAMQIFVLGPAVLSLNQNNSSIILRVQYKDVCLLFTGDAEKEQEEHLVSLFEPWLQCNVVKVAHHGSSTSSTEAFVASSGPEIAVVSVGSRNQHGLPDEEVIDRWEKSGAWVYETRSDGAILIETNGTTAEVKKWNR